MALNTQGDIRKRLAEYLSPIPVKVNVPSDRPDTFVVVTRLGGRRENKLVDNPTISIYCHASTEQKAWELANKVADFIDRLRFEDGYASITQEVMYSDVDLTTRTPRWYMRYSMQTYEN